MTARAHINCLHLPGRRSHRVLIGDESRLLHHVCAIVDAFLASRLAIMCFLSSRCMLYVTGATCTAYSIEVFSIARSVNLDYKYLHWHCEERDSKGTNYLQNYYSAN